MIIVRQFMQANFAHGYAQTMLAAIQDRANQEQIQMLERYKQHLTPYVRHSTLADSDGDDGA